MNLISSKGMHHLSKANWSALNYLRLGNYISMQVTIKLEIKDANTYRELDKTVLKRCFFVFNSLCRELFYWQRWNTPFFEGEMGKVKLSIIAYFTLH
jgi:hypothetical protein